MFTVVTVWGIGVRGASLRWKLAILDEDIELRPVAEPILVQPWPKLGLVVVCRIVDEDGDVAAQEIELFTGSPVFRSHAERKVRWSEGV